MGRATAGVLGMRFVEGDELLSMSVVRPGADRVFVVTDGGWGKRTPVERAPRAGPRRTRHPGGQGGRASGLARGRLVVHENDEILAITSSGGVIERP